ncbi:HTK16-like protein [Mya arenaria]|uniref:Tyrosine-protein kinase n=1 Tax=Mya arenaria TaxID=6604 RepID=A0ABY7G6I0_MYAAR|nr:HTK16-like protein [Mya arenaria]
MMENDTDDDQFDSIYANEETTELINVKERLQSYSLEELLKEDREKVKEKEKEKQYYHGRITRDVAEDILKKELGKVGNKDGLFLVRESSFSCSSFVLSLYSKGVFYHFQINMKCCKGNKAGIISILINEGQADVNMRNPKSGWTPMHQAAYKGHLECIKILLDFHSPYFARADDGVTPLDLTENYEHKHCFDELDKFEPSNIVTHKKDWFHPEIDRVGAQKILELKGLREGLFLVRSSKKNPDWQVLTLCHEQKVFNYQIKTKESNHQQFPMLSTPALPPRPDDMTPRPPSAGDAEYSQSVKRTSQQQARTPPTSPKLKTPPPPPNHVFHKTSINNQEDFLKEARTMQQLKHECIVNFIGISETDNHELLLVEEFIEKGSMLDYLLDHHDKINKDNLYLWAAQIALGMTYLEQQKMVHRDLAARNILLQNEKRAKISDFGLLRAVGSNIDYYKAIHVIQFIEEGKRLDKPEKCPVVAYQQMLQCWEKEPKKRPSFKMLNSHFTEESEYACVRDIMKSYR